MSHSINKEQYHERYRPPTPQKEHKASAHKAHHENRRKSEDSQKKLEAAREKTQQANEPGSE